MAIAFTTAALVIILSAMNGLTGVVAGLYNAIEPDIKITPAKGKFFEAKQDWLQSVSAVNGVDKISLCLSDNVLLKANNAQSIVMLKGVDANFKDVTRFDSVINEGSYVLKDKNNYFAVLGRGVANRLQININNLIEQIAIYSPKKGKQESINPDDNFNQKYVFPAGTFSMNDDFDYKYVFTDIELAREIFDSKNMVSSVELKIKSDAGADEVQTELQKKLGDSFVVKNRYQLNDVLFKTLETEKLWTFIILAFILIIATFNIIGALTMLIIEKKKDIKTLYYLGADNKLIRNIFMGEGFLITCIGAVIGLTLGLIVCFLQMHFHLVTFEDQYIIPYYPIELQLKDFIWIVCLIMLIGFFAALYPVRVFTHNDFVHGND